MCFNARFLLKASLKRAIHNNNKTDEAYWRSLLKQYDDWYQISGFAHPEIIVYTNNNPLSPQRSIWGLVPDWAKDPAAVWNQTLNARGETIFEKPSFKKSAESKRCLIPADGFYEHHDYGNKKYPFYIHRKDGEPLYFAGLWNEWTNRATGEIINTCSIVTTQANALMAKIHNNPKNSDDHRMPVIFPDNIADEWLRELSRAEIQELATYVFPDSMLDAWTVPKLSGKESPGNVPESNRKVDYPELVFDKGPAQGKLF